nr:YbhB/YbcL family Raf kinase inhibitor-like protein [Sphingomonas brevis]
MRRGTAAALLAVATSCGASREEAAENGLKLHSSAFADGQALPVEFTCDGTGRSPPLNWSDPPAGTRSFALVVDDPDAPNGTFRHWGAYNIPSVARELAPGAGNHDEGPMGQARNDFGKPGYGGACPPKGHGPHHYRFRLMALDIENLEIGESPDVKALEAATERHLAGRAQLTGTYERK